MCAQVSAIEEITVRSSSSQHENKPILLLAVNQKPVRFDVAFVISLVPSLQLMIVIMLWQRYIFVKKIDNILQLLKIMAM